MLLVSLEIFSAGKAGQGYKTLTLELHMFSYPRDTISSLIFLGYGLIQKEEKLHDALKTQFPIHVCTVLAPELTEREHQKPYAT